MASQVKTNAVRLLENTAISFNVHEYDVSDGEIDAQSIARKLNVDGDQVFKTLVAESQEKEHFVFVVPAVATLNLKKAARAAEKKSMEMLPLKQLFPLTGYQHGGCSPIGMKKLFPTFLDETAMLYDTICVSGGAIGLNLEIQPDVLLDFVNAQYAPLTVS